VEQELILCEVVKIHINEAVLKNGAIDQYKIDLYIRLGSSGIRGRIKVV
jgi:hypothetical protein